MSSRLRIVAAVTLLAALAGVAAVSWWRTHNVGPVQRGARLAAERGCLACHSPAGRQADPDGSRNIGSVPAFDNEDLTAHARSEEEIREWILDGRPRRFSEEPAGEPLPSLQMPAWRKILRPAEVADLVTYIKAVSDFDPMSDEVAAGRETAARLGCFACHGPQGRGDTPNPGSLKGYIPSWSGEDFPELAQNDGEIREWVREGASRRLRGNPVAAFFLRRQAIRMPAFGDRVKEQEIEAITRYIHWLRRPDATPTASR